VSIVPNYGGDLGISGLVLLTGKPDMRNHVSPRVSTLTGNQETRVKERVDGRRRLE
jgi:hypothetical protein